MALFPLPSQEALVTGGGDILRRAGLANMDRDVDSFRRANSFASGGFSTSGKTAWSKFDDPTYVSFRFQFNFFQSPLFSQALLLSPDANLSNATASAASAFSLLKKIAPNRATYLSQFVRTLYDIQNNSHYIFTGVNGLDGAWEKAITSMQDPFRGADSTIDITMLESVDFKATALMSLYRLAMYDFANRRTIIPRNLRFFDVDIYVQEIRNFRQTFNAITGVQAISGGSPTITAGKFVNDNISTVVFRFKDCEWIPETSKTIFENLTSTPSDAATQTIAFKYNDFEQEVETMMIDEALIDKTFTNTGNLSTISTLIEKLKDEAPDAALKYAGRQLKASTLNLGRIPLDTATANAELRRSLAQTFTAANLAQGSLDSGLSVGFIPSNIDIGLEPESVFDSPTSSQPILPGNTSVFDAIVSSNQDLNPSNIFINDNPISTPDLGPENVLGQPISIGSLSPDNVLDAAPTFGSLGPENVLGTAPTFGSLGPENVLGVAPTIGSLGLENTLGSVPSTPNLGSENAYTGSNPYEPAPLAPTNILGDALPPGPLPPSNVFL